MKTTVQAADEIIDRYYPVLDYGFVALQDYMGGDEAIESAARTSYGKVARKKSDTRSLIRHLYRNHHTSPLEHLVFRFHMAMPIFVARQLVRVRTGRLNELSGRYSVMPDLYYTPSEDQVLAQSRTNKQGRGESLPREYVEDFLGDCHSTTNICRERYEEAVEAGVAKELARINLPLSQYTVWVWQIDGNNLCKTLKLRCDRHAQWETRQYANILAGILKVVAPITFEAWVDFSYGARTFSRQDWEALRNPAEKYQGSESEFQEFVEKKKPIDIPSFDLPPHMTAGNFETLYQGKGHETKA